jgi:hypothetical protein
LQPEQLIACLLGVKRSILESDADPQPDLAGLCGDVVSGDLSAAAGRCQKGAEHAHCRRLARAVRPKEAVDLTGSDSQVDLVDGAAPVEMPDQGLCVHRVVGSVGCRDVAVVASVNRWPGMQAVHPGIAGRTPRRRHECPHRISPTSVKSSQLRRSASTAILEPPDSRPASLLLLMRRSGRSSIDITAEISTRVLVSRLRSGRICRVARLSHITNGTSDH